MKKINYKENDSINGLIFLQMVAPHICASRPMRKALFRCKCGKTFETIIASVTSGNTTSCGCWGSESRSIRFKKHGMRQTKIYKIWCMVKTRCYNKNRKDFSYYGGRGILMSDEFKNSFQVFYDYVSTLPQFENIESAKLTIDRIKTNGNYERGNLRWATRKEQANNRRPRNG